MLWNIVLERRTKNRLNESKTKKKLREIAGSASRNTSLGFEGRVGRLREPEKIQVDGEELYRYLVRLRLEKTNGRDSAIAEKHFEHVMDTLAKKAVSEGWQVLGEKIEKKKVEKTDEEVPFRPLFQIPELTQEVIIKYFSGIYDREFHIRLMHDSVKNYFDTLAMNLKDPSVEISRSHTLLKGDPGGCKTRLLERFKTWYEDGSPTERILFVDGPTMSKAGLENHLLNMAARNALPEIVVIEELEKQNQDNLLTLLSVMGSGYISKLNARVGHRKEIANILVWGTCNDEHVVRNFRNGALWSRFCHRLHCPRPSRVLMEQILLDQVTKMGGNPEWAKAAIRFAYDQLGAAGRPMTDPREIKALLDGRDRLLDGSYQMDKLKIIKMEVEEKEQKIVEEENFF
jgi:hypothetical protein